MRFALLAALLCAAPTVAVAAETRLEASEAEVMAVCAEAWGPESQFQMPDTTQMSDVQVALYQNGVLMQIMEQHNIAADQFPVVQKICTIYLHGVNDMAAAVVAHLAAQPEQVALAPSGG